MRGGSTRSGWAIWEYPGLYYEAEYHCVWESQGKFFDLAPKQHKKTNILFLPDPVDKTSNSIFPVSTEFFPLSKHPDVQNYIITQQKIAERLREIQNSARQGSIGLHSALANLQQLTMLRNKAFSKIQKLVFAIHPDRPCPCGCGSLLKNCVRS